ncbi:MAG: NLP/P60 family protein [uncultured Sulfurovum sp.]|uniref:NLP/P60 family protein n=1 Tax=uncultured Sulfurovum sp. TaxID=269237 RepID=A0A6S6U9G4_9BACT|nr:MAG: NLP/P60 family protein [uncultured Sulfurovum sp.]
MYKNFFTFLFISQFLCANYISISDTNGKVVKRKYLTHKTNAFFSQNPTEYSLQAIYDELHRASKLAKVRHETHQKALGITKKQIEAKRDGRSYVLSQTEKDALLEDAKYFKGGKYIWGGTTPHGFDCSGYVQYLYKKHHINLPRTALSQSKRGTPISKKHLQKGDLVFFLTDKKRGIPVTHVGIYLGDGQFIHAASKKKGIIISPLHTGYYAKKFVSASRVLPQG